MPVSMYDNSVPVFQRLMRNMIAILDKAEAHAKAKKIDEEVFVNARLSPDMFPLKRQIQIASDMAKAGVARLAGADKDMPKWEDNETTFAGLKARLQKLIDYIGAFKAAQIDGSEMKDVNLTIGGQPKTLKGHQYLMTHAYPHFNFHITTTYNILRHNGVEIGKGDFVGKF